MYANYQMNVDELNINFLQSIKDNFEGKNIEIAIFDCDETEYLCRSPKNKQILYERMQDVKENKNLTSFSIEEIEKML